MEEEVRNNFIMAVKNEVAKNAGFPNMLNGHWATAMQLKHRTMRQLELYEDVINAIIDLFENKLQNGENNSP